MDMDMEMEMEKELSRVGDRSGQQSRGRRTSSEVISSGY